jgi:hypothetical protein
MGKIVLKYAIAFCLFLPLAETATAQCAMCKAAAESDEKANKGLNSGIIYLLSMPYILIGTVGYLWWKNRSDVAVYEEEQELRRLLHGRNS